MVKKWVTDAYKKILVENCQDYLASNNHGRDKVRKALITQVAEEITAAATESGDEVPANLEKVSLRCETLCLPIVHIMHRSSEIGSETKQRRLRVRLTLNHPNQPREFPIKTSPKSIGTIEQ
jgi:hypothetical protein